MFLASLNILCITNFSDGVNLVADYKYDYKIIR